MELENVFVFVIVLQHFRDITIANLVLSRHDSDLILLVICIICDCKQVSSLLTVQWKCLTLNNMCCGVMASIIWRTNFFSF
jgi:hypothetical protein